MTEQNLDRPWADRPTARLIIEPRGGLCNRMRAIDGALSLGRAMAIPVHLTWRVDQSLGCQLADIFDAIPGITQVREIRRFRLVQKDSVWLRRKLGRGPWPTVLLQRDVAEALNAQQDVSKFANRHGLYLRTWNRVHGTVGPKHLFRPTAKLQAEIEAVAKDFRNTIGVHIRHGDHGPSKQYSPTELFQAELGKQFARDPTLTAFLATDDPSAETALRQAYGERIMVRPKSSLNRASARAIQEAVIDLFCLARTKRILGSTESSFSTMAAELGEIPIDIISNWSGESLDWGGRLVPKGSDPSGQGREA